MVLKIGLLRLLGLGGFCFPLTVIHSLPAGMRGGFLLQSVFLRPAQKPEEGSIP